MDVSERVCGILERVKDSELLYGVGWFEGDLLCACVKIAGAARIKYA